MSIEVDYNEVSKSLALKLADLEYQLAAYKNLASRLEKELEALRNQGVGDDDGSTVSEV